MQNEKSEMTVGPVYLIGARSPIVPEYEEALECVGMELAGHILLEEKPRVLAMSKVIKMADLDGSHKGCPAYAAAFSPKRRMDYVAVAKELGFSFGPAIIHPSGFFSKYSRIGDGSFVAPIVNFGTNGFIGDHVFLNRGANIGHHVLIDDYVSIAPGVSIGGNVRIGEGSLVGIGATVYPEVTIGERAIVAGGSVVREDVPANCLVAGNPAVIKKYDVTKSIFDQTVQE